MKWIVFNKRTLLVIIVVVLILVVSFIYLVSRDLLVFTGLTRYRRVERIGDFIVLDDPYKAGEIKLYHDIVLEVDHDFRHRLLKSLVKQCRNGELFVKQYDKAILYVNCTFIRIRVDNTMIREGEPVETPEFIPIAINESGTHTFINPQRGYVRVYYTKLYLTVQLPENVVQGLTIDPEEYFEQFKPSIEIIGTTTIHYIRGEEEFYRVANVPYFYFNATFIKGAYKTWYMIKARISVNDVNMTDPYYYRYGSNGDYSGVVSIFDGYMSESEIMEYYDALKPLLEITGGRVVTIVWYIEIYVYPAGEFEIEFTIGYPALRVVTT